MLTESDIAINLMKDKPGGEDVYFHSLNVTLLSMMLAKELKAPPEAIRLIGMGAMFHDVGKLDIPDRIVRKTEPLTKPELSLLQQHCAYGVETGRKLSLPNEALTVIAQHHEYSDGTGYPKGLKGSDIFLLARVVAIVNCYDNLCNPVKQSAALTPHQALSLMYAQQRARFDTAALTTFVRCMGIYPPGTVVVLSNESIGMVVSVNSTVPLKPTVLIYDPAVPRERAILVELESEPEVSISRALKPEQLPKPVYDYLAPRRRLTYYFDSESSAAAP
ncbi:MAG: HD domain-containing protein [Rhodoferax sp.]|nr:HD domain-containing protein [Rhodoferax sp.]